jgi:hypothetical protein
LGERLLCKQEVDGSIPFTSTRAVGRFDREVCLPKASDSGLWR